MFGSLIVCVLYTQLAGTIPISGKTYNSWNNARDYCARRNQILPLPQEDQIASSLLDKMIYSNINYVWTRIRKNLSEGRWLSGTLREAELPFDDNTDVPEMECGLFNAFKRNVRYQACSKASYGYVCIMKSDPGCKLSVLGNHAIYLPSRNGCIILSENKVPSWIAAMRMCVSLGLKPAELDKYLLNMLSSKLPPSMQGGQFWVGYRKNTFISEIEGANIDIFDKRWGANEPSGLGDCVSFEQSGKWRSTSCQEKHHFFCQNKAFQDYFNSQDEGRQEIHPKTDNIKEPPGSREEPSKNSAQSNISSPCDIGEVAAMIKVILFLSTFGNMLLLVILCTPHSDKISKLFKKLKLRKSGNGVKNSSYHHPRSTDNPSEQLIGPETPGSSNEKLKSKEESIQDSISDKTVIKNKRNAAYRRPSSLGHNAKN